jgi:hypothetical protein
MIEPPIFDVSGVHGASGTSGEDLVTLRLISSQHGLRGGHGTMANMAHPLAPSQCDLPHQQLPRTFPKMWSWLTPLMRT